MLLSFFALSHSFAAPEVIYGGDDRMDVNDSLEPVHRDLSQSVAVMIEKNLIYSAKNGLSSISPKTLKERHKVCESDRFAHQQSASTCTGFLISPKLLVTAGHCMKGKSCAENSWVFDYKLRSEKSKNVGFIANSSIYSCKRVVDKKYSAFTSKDDWAIVELDREVKDRSPLALSERIPKASDSIFVIGSPIGLPLKVATGKVRQSYSNYFNTNLDTFMGNSGSPVFNSKTLEVEGILVRGEVDYDHGWHTLGCGKVITYPEDGGRGEEATSIKLVKKTLQGIL